MSKDHEGDIKAFSHVSRAWYGPQLKLDRFADEVMFGFYSPDGGTSGEMAMRWYDLNRELTPRLEVFCDAWHALAQFTNVLAMLADLDGKDITPEQFCSVLLSLGFEDRTPVDDEKRQRLEAALQQAAKRERAQIEQDDDDF